jgi:hypothetical protein
VEVSGGDSPADASAPAEPVLLAARAPSRFLSIEAASGGGRVHVEVVQEGSLRVDSGGGDISVPKASRQEGGLYRGAATPLRAAAAAAARMSSCCACCCQAPSQLSSVHALSSGPVQICLMFVAWSPHLGSRAFDWLPRVQVKAVEAHLRSGGGAITGSVTGAEVALDSGGGAVQLRSLVGKAVAVRSGRPGGGGGGGAITLGACYADALQLDSGDPLVPPCGDFLLALLPVCGRSCCVCQSLGAPGNMGGQRGWKSGGRQPGGAPHSILPRSLNPASVGPPPAPAPPLPPPSSRAVCALMRTAGGGPVHVTTMDCRGGLAVLCSGGGAVAVDSLDGSLRVESGGGAVAAQLADGAGRVSVASGGGDVQLFLSPGVAGQLRVRAAARVAARPGTLRLAEMQDDGSLLFRLPLESASGVAAMSSGFAAAAAAAAAAGAGAGGPGAPQPPPPPPSRLQRGGGAAGGAPPPPGNAVSQAGREAAAGAAIEIDAGTAGKHCHDLRGRGTRSCRAAHPTVCTSPLNEASPPPHSRVCAALHAGGSGTLTLTQRSWADALRQRWS